MRDEEGKHGTHAKRQPHVADVFLRLEREKTQRKVYSDLFQSYVLMDKSYKASHMNIGIRSGP